MLFQKSGEAQSKTAAHCLLYVFRGIITVLRIFFVLKISGSEAAHQGAVRFSVSAEKISAGRIFSRPFRLAHIQRKTVLFL